MLFLTTPFNRGNKTKRAAVEGGLEQNSHSLLYISHAGLKKKGKEKEK